jgi:hypothetical protein
MSNVPGAFCFANTFGECKNCGSLAMFTAIRRASSFVSSLDADLAMKLVDYASRSGSRSRLRRSASFSHD